MIYNTEVNIQKYDTTIQGVPNLYKPTNFSRYYEESENKHISYQYNQK